MSNLIALEWDDAEARVAVADSRRGSVVLEQAFSVALPKDKTSPEASGATGTISISGAYDLGAIGRRINDALTARGIRRVRTLVGVGRANIELKNLTLPPAPPDELPELVRFQAEREFNTLSDEWPLDFLPIPGDEGEAITVLAAAISPELVNEIQVTCEAANLTPQRLILRPCGAASLLSRASPGDESKLRLLVDLLSEEADLTVLAGNSVVFMRTPRLPAESAHTDPLRTLLPEVRRTIAAVHARFHGRHIEEVFLCGESSGQAALAREIGRELELPTQVFNPLTYCTLAGDLRRNMPEHPGRFAPLVGMLLDEASGDGNTIDFLNPRKKAQPKSRRRQWTIAAAAAAVLVAAGAFWIWFQLNSLDSQIADLDSRWQQLAAEEKSQTLNIDRAAAIDKALAGEVNWLDELTALAEKAPKNQDLMVTQVTTSSDDRAKTNVIKLELLAADKSVDDKVIEALTDKSHKVFVKREAEDATGQSRYPWKLTADIELKRPEPPAAGAKKSTTPPAK